MDITPLYEIVPIPGKGMGVVAKTSIHPGKTILRDHSLMKVSKPAQQLTDADMQTAFSSLTPSEQTAVLALHEGDALEASQLLRIFKANCFGSTEACWLLPIISRLNHSCVANASVDRGSEGGQGEGEAQVIAEKHISAGEEICFSYSHELYEITTARQRAVLLRKQYGFACTCRACGGEGEALSRGSDARRAMIRGLRGRLHGLETADFSRLENVDPLGEAVMQMSEFDFWVKEEMPMEGVIPADERAAKNLLLGRLREAEGLPAVHSAQCYLHAAEAMYEQVLGMTDVVVLQWARACRTLMQKAIALVDGARSRFDEDAQMLRATWKVMESKPAMKVALDFLDGTITTPVFKRETQVGPTYAIFIVDGKTLQAVSQAEYLSRSASRKDLQNRNNPGTTGDHPDRSWTGGLWRHLKKSGETYKTIGSVVALGVGAIVIYSRTK